MTKHKLLFSVMLAAGLACAAVAQPPAQGHIAGHAYVNPALHLSYTWPAILQADPVPAAQTQQNDPHAYQFVLFSAKQGKQPYGLMMMAEKLNVAGPHSGGIKSSADMITRLANSLRPGPVLTNIAKSQHKTASGRQFDELTYSISGKPAAVLATQVGEYLIVFKCNAASAHDMALMEKSALALRVGK
ncbi:MAG: hypothetical protein ACLGSD_01660 [Acidobacteriota bacterium]